MPAKWFKCPGTDNIVPINECLMDGGCIMGNRCSTRPYLRLAGFDREWKGITPSVAGNGPRYLYLKATKDYTIDPDGRAWASFGIGTHGKVSVHKYTQDVFSEEKLSDEKITGISDCLEKDEKSPWDDSYILSDYKTWGSFKVAKAMGIVKVKVPILDEAGNNVLFKSGKNKGLPKTEPEFRVVKDKIDLKGEELQLNRYRILFERYGFPVSRMQIQVLARDGGTYISDSRGITKNLYIIPIRRLPDKEVLNFYSDLNNEVNYAFESGEARRCNSWESWEGRRCNEKYCEVKKYCDNLKKGENK